MLQGYINQCLYLFIYTYTNSMFYISDRCNLYDWSLYLKLSPEVPPFEISYIQQQEAQTNQFSKQSSPKKNSVLSLWPLTDQGHAAQHPWPSRHLPRPPNGRGLQERRTSQPVPASSARAAGIERRNRLPPQRLHRHSYFNPHSAFIIQPLASATLIPHSAFIVEVKLQ